MSFVMPEVLVEGSIIHLITVGISSISLHVLEYHQIWAVSDSDSGSNQNIMNLIAISISIRSITLCISISDELIPLLIIWEGICGSINSCKVWHKILVLLLKFFDTPYIRVQLSSVEDWVKTFQRITVSKALPC